MWSFPGDNQATSFCMCHVVMDNKPSTNINLLAFSDMAKLRDNSVKYPAAHQTILRNIYVRNMSRFTPNMEHLYSSIEQIEAVCKQGGFSFKE